MKNKVQQLSDIAQPIIMMLRKSVKSLQLALNELTQVLCWNAPVSNAAYTKARQKIDSNTNAFVEMNRKAVLEMLCIERVLVAERLEQVFTVRNGY